MCSDVEYQHQYTDYFQLIQYSQDLIRGILQNYIK